MRTGTIFHIAVVLCALTLCPARPAGAQSARKAIAFDDFGLMQPLVSSARASAMGSAYVAVANDVHSLLFNPAGLARVKRTEFSLGLQQERLEIENAFFGSSTGVDKHDAGIDALSVAVPIPTYRGSLVVAFGVYRLFSAHMDLHYQGTNAADETVDNYLLQQSGSIYGYNLGFGVDLSPTLSGGLSVFIVDGTIDVLEQYDRSFLDAVPGLSSFVTNEQTLDVDGVGARVGMQFYFHELLRVGVSIHTPVLVNVNGRLFSEASEHVDNGIDTFEQITGDIDTDYVLPFRADLGVAATWNRVTASVEFGYSDWSEASIDRKRLRAPGSLEPVFKEVFEFRVGAEWTLPWLPVRLRGGFTQRPYPLRFLQSDRIDNENLEMAKIDDDLSQISFGFGVLLGRVMMIDATYIRASGTRSTPTLFDDRVTRRYLLTASYRL